MKLTDVVNQLRVQLPKYTDLLSSTGTAIVSISAAANVATIATDVAHWLVVGGSVTLSDVRFRNTIDSVSQEGLVFTFGTAVAHDLTEGWRGDLVTLSGFTDPAWNGDITLLRAPNRNTFKVQSAEALPVLSGSELLLELRDDGVNGRFMVASVPTATTFTIESEFLDGDYSGGELHTGVRVAGAVDFERAEEAYTSQGADDLWAFVVMSNVVTSKNRDAYSDAVSTLPVGTDVRTRQLDGFTIFLFANCSDQLTAVEAVDLCRHTLLSPIYKSVFGAMFESGLSGEDFKAVPISLGSASYTRSVYIHRYDFQVPFDVINSDTVEPGDTRAFRDIDFTEEVGENELTITVNLDDEPE